MSAYLDTQVAVWLSQGAMDRMSAAATRQMAETNLLLSPMALLELEYLYEIRRILLSAEAVRLKLEHELGVIVCQLDFAAITNAALNEKWTRDPFDRLIVANAKANGLSPLISADEEIRSNYPRAVW